MARTAILRVFVGMCVACLPSCGAASEPPEEADSRIGQVPQAASTDFGAGFAVVSGTGTPATVSNPFNTSGGSVGAGNPTTGVYTVGFTNLNSTVSGGNVQVVAAKAGIRCKVASWVGAGTTENVGVRCHTANGTPVNATFFVHFLRKPSGAGAYLWADQPSTASYQANAFYSFNSTGSANVIKRLAKGVYTATMPMGDVSGGTVEVTAYGTGPEHCKVESWIANSNKDAVMVTVRCFDAAGSLVDTKFSLNYWQNHTARIFDAGAYAWANDMTSSSYTPAPAYSFDSTSSLCGAASITAGRQLKGGTGKYFVQFSDLFNAQNTPFVTAYGSDSSFCNVQTTIINATGPEVFVQCFDATGAAVDSRFVVTLAETFHRSGC